MILGHLCVKNKAADTEESGRLEMHRQGEEIGSTAPGIRDAVEGDLLMSGRWVNPRLIPITVHMLPRAGARHLRDKGYTECSTYND